MTAPTQELTDADVVKLRDRLTSHDIAVVMVKNPIVFENQGGGGGADRPTSGIVYP